MPVRVLLLSAEFGSGHQSAANAIADACRALSPECEAVVVQCQSPLLGLFSRAYLWQIKHVPAAYRRLYHLPVGWPLRQLVVLVLGRPVRRIVAAHKPDVIVGTHPFPAGAAVRLMSRARLRRIPVVMALTDFAPHGFWIWPGVARYCCASAEAAAELVRRGADGQCVTVTGVPVRAALADVDPALSVRRRTGHVLVMGGGLGLGPIAAAVGALLSLPYAHLRVTVICGRNRALQEQLTRRFGTDPRLAVLGFTDRVIDHMCAADLLVTKPGGITCAEALALGLPMLLLPPLPGHEEENARYLVETGAARVAVDAELAAAVDELLFAHPDRLEPMAKAARLAGQPAAARAIAEQVMKLASQPVAGA